MLITIPIATGQVTPDEVYGGIDAQTVPCTPIICATDGVIASQRNHSAERVAGELASRRLCQERAAETTDKYVIMMDSDCVLTDPRAIADMMWELDANDHIGGVALWFGSSPKRIPKEKLYIMRHTVIRCVMYRREVLLDIDFSELRERCSCIQVRKEIERQGLQFRYLDFKKRAIEINT